MRGGLTKVAAFLLAAIGVVIAWLLAFGAAAVAARGYPMLLDRRPVTASPMSTGEMVAVIVFAAVAAVAAVLLVVWSSRRAAAAEVKPLKPLDVRSEQERERKAA